MLPVASGSCSIGVQIMWSRIGVVGAGEKWSGNHFVPLLTIKQDREGLEDMEVSCSGRFESQAQSFTPISGSVPASASTSDLVSSPVSSIHQSDVSESLSDGSESDISLSESEEVSTVPLSVFSAEQIIRSIMCVDQTEVLSKIPAGDKE